MRARWLGDHLASRIDTDSNVVVAVVFIGSFGRVCLSGLLSEFTPTLLTLAGDEQQRR